MADLVPQDLLSVPTLTTSYLSASQRQPTQTPTAETIVQLGGGIQWQVGNEGASSSPAQPAGWDQQEQQHDFQAQGLGSTGKGILIGMLSAFGSAALVALVVAIVYFFRYTNRGRILLDRIGRPGEFDDEQQFIRDEEEALAEMDDLQRAEYQRAKAFVQANPPESVQTDISLSQFLAIQEKGVSAWEFEPELEIANCFVEARTEIEFFDSECSVQSNLPIPKQNEVYYWEAKLYDKPESTLISIGVTTKPYPLFRLPGLHRYSIAYTSNGHRRLNQPFAPTNYGPPYVQGDVVGVGYRPRTGTVFFTRNGKKLEDVAHGFKAQNFFPTVGATGPCNVHVNFGQMGFVFIEANVKKWGLAPMTGSLAPPPPYGSEAGSILLEGGRDGVREGQGWTPVHGRTSSAQVRLMQGRPTRSPGPERSPTDISLAQLNLMEFAEEEEEEDVGEGRSARSPQELERREQEQRRRREQWQELEQQHRQQNQQSQQHPQFIDPGLPFEPADHPPPDYESPPHSPSDGPAGEVEVDDENTPRQSYNERQHLLAGGDSPPIPTYEAATSDVEAGRGRSSTR